MSEAEIQAAETNANAHSPDSHTMRKLAWLAFVDILVFFGVLLVGFAYLWRLGDLKWVRSMAAQAGEQGALTS